MKTFVVIILFSFVGFSQNQIKVDIASLKQIDNNNIDMYIYTRPIERANKGIKVEINVYESDFIIYPHKKKANRLKKAPHE